MIDFIAEIGVNHEGSIEKAKQMILECKEAGCNCVKFQTYKAEKIAAVESPAYWDLESEKTTSQHELFKKYDCFGFSEFSELKNYCDQIDIEFMSTPFDLDAVDMLDPLVERYKVASVDLTNKPLIRRIASKNKPVILSTGASTLDEIRDAVDELLNLGVKKISLLHCVINYPTPFERANLSAIKQLQLEFPNLTIGYSDHTKPTEDHIVQRLALSLGATIIEKHYTFDKTLPGNDHYHSYDKQDLSKFLELAKSDSLLFGAGVGIDGQEMARKHARRGFYAAANMEEGHVISEDDLIMKRPATDIPAKDWDAVIGKKLVKRVLVDEALNKGAIDWG